MGMASLLDDTKFREFLVSGSGRYQPIPISGLYNPHAVRAEGCNRRWEAVKNILPKDTPLRILDVGCSLGFFGMVGADAGFSVDGFDTDVEAVFWGSKVIEEYNIPNVTLRHSGEDLLQELQKIPDDEYDYVFYFSLHHHMCSKLGIDAANDILQEMSRIAPNMVFDMGQSNEVDNGWLTWLRKIPQFEDHRIELPEWVLDKSGYNYAACIGDSRSHEVDRLLFLFIKGIPDGVERRKEIITTNTRGYNIKYYMWKDRGGYGKVRQSTNSFPIMDLRSTMASRYYLATDMGGQHYFIKEHLYCWLSPNKNYEHARATYERGKRLQNIPEVCERVVFPIEIEGNFVVYPYYNWPALHTLDITDLKHNFFSEIVEVAGRIYREIGVFDLNPNNILYNKETGEFKLVDFEPPISSNFTFDIFNARVGTLYRVFEGVFGADVRKKEC
jgi:SAM-dependent methyltransferase